MDLRDSLAMHPASLPTALDARSLKRDTPAIHHALPTPEAVNIRDSLAMHPAVFPLQAQDLPQTMAKAA